jgi:hypothetical protein
VNQQGFPNHGEIEKNLSDSLILVERFPITKLNLTQINYAKAQLHEKAAYWYFIYNDWENGSKNLIQAGDLHSECIENKERIIHVIASAGFESALYHIGNKVPDLLNYLEEFYYFNLNNIWPNALLSDPVVKGKIKAAFCHIIACDEKIKKTRKENIQLCTQAFSYGRYLRSLTTWKIFLKNLLLLNEK